VLTPIAFQALMLTIKATGAIARLTAVLANTARR
jgi:hypothetical protein